MPKATTAEAEAPKSWTLDDVLVNGQTLASWQNVSQPNPEALEVTDLDGNALEFDSLDGNPANVRVYVAGRPEVPDILPDTERETPPEQPPADEADETQE